MPDVQLTWLGHAAFRFDTPGGKRVYVDPFLSGNPKTPEAEKEPERVDVIAITHAHGDHVGDTVEIWKRHRPSIVAIVEIKSWLARRPLLTRFGRADASGAAALASASSSA